MAGFKVKKNKEDWVRDGVLLSPEEYVLTPDGYDLQTPLNIKSGYIVVPVYTTGNSFGRDDTLHEEYFAVTEKLETAVEIAGEIVRQNNALKNTFSFERKKNQLAFEYTASDGQVFKETYVAWNGYFEELEHVIVAKFKVEE